MGAANIAVFLQRESTLTACLLHEIFVVFVVFGDVVE